MLMLKAVSVVLHKSLEKNRHCEYRVMDLEQKLEERVAALESIMEELYPHNDVKSIDEWLVLNQKVERLKQRLRHLDHLGRDVENNLWGLLNRALDHRRFKMDPSRCVGKRH